MVELPPGEYNVRASDRMGKTLDFTVAITAGETREEVVELPGPRQ